MKKNQLFYHLIHIAIIFLSGPGSFIMAQTTITGGTTLTVLPGTTLSSGENLDINTGATLDNQGTLLLKKNLANSNAAANSVGAGMVLFSGTSAQAISGLNIIKHITVNNPAGLIVSGNTRVNGTLTLTNGRVSLGSSNLLLGPSAAVSGNPGASAMVVPAGTGQLQKEYSAIGSFTFPVGDVTGIAEYSPVTLQFNSGVFNPKPEGLTFASPGQRLGLASTRKVFHPDGVGEAQEVQTTGQSWQLYRRPSACNPRGGAGTQGAALG